MKVEIFIFNLKLKTENQLKQEIQKTVQHWIDTNNVRDINYVNQSQGDSKIGFLVMSVWYTTP